MTNLTLSMPDDISKSMKNFSEVKWSEVARKAIIEKIKTLEIAEKLAKKSEFSKEDAEQFDKLLKKSANKRFN